MVKYVIGLICIISVISGCDKDSQKSECDFTDAYYYQGSLNVIGEISEEYILIGSDSSNTDESIRAFVASNKKIDQDYFIKIKRFSNYQYKQVVLKLKKRFNCGRITKIIEDIEQDEVVDYAHFGIETTYCNDDYGYPIGEKCIYSYSGLFNVKVKDPNNLSDLINTIEETNTMLIEQNKFMDDWVTLEATKNSEGDAMQMANYFYETGLFEACEPDILLLPVE